MLQCVCALVASYTGTSLASCRAQRMRCCRAASWPRMICWGECSRSSSPVRVSASFSSSILNRLHQPCKQQREQ